MRPERVRREAAPADHPEKKDWIKITKATSDINPPETVLGPMFDDRSGKRRVTGPAMMAIDGSHETAWGIDAGPGRRNVARKIVFTPEKPAKFEHGAILTFSLEQNHGGWNSDDLMTNNLGRFRISATTTPDATADPLPAAVREILAISADQRTPAQIATVFSHWRTTVPEWKDANAQIEALWKDHPAGTTTLASKAGRSRGRRISSSEASS